MCEDDLTTFLAFSVSTSMMLSQCPFSEFFVVVGYFFHSFTVSYSKYSSYIFPLVVDVGSSNPGELSRKLKTLKEIETISGIFRCDLHNVVSALLSF